MADIAPTLTPHTVVLCVEKRERAVALQQTLQKLGFRIVMALTMYDALKFIAQEMPHLVICEAILSDGNVGLIYDRLQQHATLKKTPILVHVIKKTKAELDTMAGRKFAGFFLGPFEPKSFLTKVLEVISLHARVSPYFVPSTAIGISPDLTISIEATVVGKSGEQLVSRSGTEVDPAASMLCVPGNAEYGPAVLRMATNLRSGDEIFNLFPISRIVGAGRKWILALPDFKVGEPSVVAESRLHKVIYYDPSEERFAGFRDILKGYQVELVHAKSLNTAAALVKRDHETIAAVYLHELMADASSLEWKNTYSKLPAGKKPPIIVGTTSLNARSTSEMRYIKRPFGMGLFVEMLQAAFERAGDIAGAMGKNASTDIKGVPVKYQAQAKLVGLDETGGVMEVRFPLVKGSRFTIKHEFLHRAWEGKTNVQVVGSAATGSADVYHARFEAIEAGTSKVKYWDKLEKLLVEAQAAAAPAKTA